MKSKNDDTKLIQQDEFLYEKGMQRFYECERNGCGSTHLLIHLDYIVTDALNGFNNTNGGPVYLTMVL